MPVLLAGILSLPMIVDDRIYRAGRDLRPIVFKGS